MCVCVCVCVCVCLFVCMHRGQEKNLIKMRCGNEVMNAPENIFVGYDTGALAAFYVEIVKESPTAVDWIQRKYSLLQPRVEHLAQSGARWIIMREMPHMSRISFSLGH